MTKTTQATRSHLLHHAILNPSSRISPSSYPKHIKDSIDCQFCQFSSAQFSSLVHCDTLPSASDRHFPSLPLHFSTPLTLKCSPLSASSPCSLHLLDRSFLHLRNLQSSEPSRSRRQLWEREILVLPNRAASWLRKLPNNW